MKPLFSAKKTDTTTFDFFPLTHHPEALLVKAHGDGIKGYAFITPRATVDRLREKDEPVVKFYTGHGDGDGYGYASLPPNARYWLVPREALAVEDTDKYLFEYGQELLDHVEDPDWVPVYKSDRDHQVWSIEGEPILMPVAVELWETRFDLKAVEKHLAGLKHPGVVGFTIRPNACVPNWAISGRNEGRLVLDTARLGINFRGFKGSVLLTEQQDTPRASRSWLQDYVVDCHEGVKYDVLGLQAFKRPGPGRVQRRPL